MMERLYFAAFFFAAHRAFDAADILARVSGLNFQIFLGLASGVEGRPGFLLPAATIKARACARASISASTSVSSLLMPNSVSNLKMK
jgi:hypothetical protein